MTLDMERNNYYRLIALLVDVSPKVVRRFFERQILQGSSFESYIEMNKHKIFHFMSSIKCCQCIDGENENQKILLSDQQPLISCEPPVSGPNCGSENKCICKYNGKDCVVLYLTTLICLLIHCENVQQSNDKVYQWIVQLKQAQNKIFHKADERSVSCQDFNIIWNQISDVLVGVAEEISNQYVEETKKVIEYLKTRELTKTDQLTENTFIEEWYMIKSCELKNMIQEMKRKAKHDERKFEDWINNSMKIYEERTAFVESVTKLLGETLCTLIRDKQNRDNCFDEQNDINSTTEKTLIPVLLHIEIPKHWNQSQINVNIMKSFDALNVLSGNLKFKYLSTATQTMLLYTIKSPPDVIDNEILGFLEKILITSEVDTSTKGNVLAHLTVVVEKDIPPIPDQSVTTLVEQQIVVLDRPWFIEKNTMAANISGDKQNADIPPIPEKSLTASVDINTEDLIECLDFGFLKVKTKEILIVCVNGDNKFLYQMFLLTECHTQIVDLHQDSSVFLWNTKYSFLKQACQCAIT